MIQRLPLHRRQMNCIQFLSLNVMLKGGLLDSFGSMPQPLISFAQALVSQEQSEAFGLLAALGI